MMQRVKVRCIHPRKTFFEKVLMEWKETIDDRNFRFVVSKAHSNLKNFPLEVSTIRELKNVKGLHKLYEVIFFSAILLLSFNSLFFQLFSFLLFTTYVA